MKLRRVAFAAIAALALAGASNPRTETVHTVKEGETLRGIANRAGVSLTIIAEANGIPEPYDVRIGQRLVIPRQRTHVVKRGDSLSVIAERYGVPQSQIAMANGIDSPNDIRIGQRLIIPAVLPERASNAAATPREPYFRRPHDGRVLLGWQRRADGGGHDGIDFAVNTGDMVRAASSGTIIFAGAEPKRFGNLVVIDHGNGWQSRYGHLARVTVQVGDPIKTGERVGIAGQSGVATRPELHFDIRRDGRPVDPTKRLRLGN